LKVMRDGRPVTVEVTSDGAGLVSHAGSALLAQVADKVGLTSALSLRLGVLKQRRRGCGVSEFVTERPNASPPTSPTPADNPDQRHPARRGHPHALIAGSALGQR